jgi:HTH-type transcriptional regulator / antitoxin HigA
MAKRQMDIRPIRTDADYEWGLQEIERLMDAKAGSSDGDRLDVLATLVSAYEAQHFPMERPDPIAAIEFRMEQRGMTRKDLEKALGGKSRVSEVLNRRRALTVSMIRKLSRSFDIPSDVLIGEYALRKAGGARKGSARGRGRRAG